MSPTTTSTRAATTGRVLGRTVQGLGFVWVFVALFYAFRTAEIEPSMITIWLVVFTGLGSAHVALGAHHRR